MNSELMSTILKRKHYEGIYDIPEAANYLRASMKNTPLNMSSRKLIRWLRLGLSFPYLTGIPGKELLITFEDLISMRIIAALRAAGVSFKRIYEAERWLRQVTKYPRPFATELLWTEHSDVFTEFQKELIAASRSGQYAMDLLREYLIPIHGLTFNRDRVVASWEPFPEVLLHPQIQFGSPCIKGTRIPTRAIWGLVKAGDPITLVAQSYGLKEEDIQKATKWEDTIAEEQITKAFNR